MRRSLASGWDSLRHTPLALLRLELRQAAVIAQRVQQHIFGHARGQAVVHQPHDRHLARQVRVVQQVLDAGAQREDHLEVRIAREIAGLGIQASA